jgi:rhizoxin biosynthesis, polyketide synthase / nonribosomal peptide synthetase RhiA
LENPLNIEALVSLERQRILSAYPELRAYVELLDIACADGKNVLLNKKSATEVLLNPNTLELLRVVYGGTARAKYFNTLIAKFVGAWVAQHNRSIRILEVGAGTGATSAPVIEQLIGSNVEFIFSDVGLSFVQAAQTRFSAYPFVTFKLFDLGRDSSLQVFEAGSIDMVIATNVVHATSVIADSLKRIAHVLAPEGVLILNEVTTNHAFNTAVFGLFDGWWAYEDNDLRIPGTPLLELATWEKTICAAGFEIDDVHALPSQVPGSAATQAVIVARLAGAASDRSSSKTDRLPHPESISRSPGSFQGGLPTGSALLSVIREKLAECVGLGVDEISNDASMAELGLDSVLSLSLKYQLEARLGVEIPMRLLTGGVTVSQLWRELDSQTRTLPINGEINTQEYAKSNASFLRTDQSVPAPNSSTPSAELFPLTPLQEAFLVGRYYSGAVGCHVYAEYFIEGHSAAHLSECWDKLVRRHSMLRCRVSEAGQSIEPHVKGIGVSSVDLSSMTLREQHLEILRSRTSMSHRKYVVDDWPLFRIEILTLDDAKCRFHLSIDEWIVDGASLEFLLKEFYALTQSRKLEPLKAEFRDYSLRLSEVKLRAESSRCIDFWRSKLLPINDSVIPFGRKISRSSNEPESARFERIEFRLSAQQSEALYEVAAAIDVSISIMLLTALAETLEAWSPGSARTMLVTFEERLPLLEGIESIVGPFTSTLIVKPAVGEFVLAAKANRQYISEGLDHASLGGVEVLRYLKKQGEIGADTKIGTVYSSRLGSTKRLPQTFAGTLAYKVTQTPQINLDCQLESFDHCINVAWDFRVDLLDSEKVNLGLLAYRKKLETLSGFSQTHQNHSASISPSSIQAIVDPTEIQKSHLFSGLGGQACFLYQEFDCSDLDVARLQFQLHLLESRHDALRLRFTDDGQTSVDDRFESKIQVLDYSKLGALEALNLSIKRRSEILSNFVPTEQAPYLRVSVICFCDEKYRVIVTADLLALDANSIQKSFEILFSDGLADSKRITPSFIEIMGLNSARRTSSQVTLDRSYWEEKFARLSGGALFPNIEVQAQSRLQEFHHRRVSAPLKDFEGMFGLADLWEVSRDSVFLACFGKFLLARCQQEQFVIPVSIWERESLHAYVDESLGEFSRQAWVEVDQRAHCGLREYAKRINTEIIQDLERLPGSGLRALKQVLAMSGTDSPMVLQVVFSGEMADTISLPNSVAKGWAISSTPGVALDHITETINHQLYLHWDFDTSVVSPDVIDRWFSDYVGILSGVGRLGLRVVHLNESELASELQDVFKSLAMGQSEGMNSEASDEYSF